MRVSGRRGNLFLEGLASFAMLLVLPGNIMLC